MNILYLSPHVPNPTKARSYYQVQGLLEAGHQLTVATVARSADDFRYIQRLRDQGIRILSANTGRIAMGINAFSALFTRQPLQAKIYWSTALWEAIQTHLHTNSVDVIHVEHLRMAGYGLRLMKDWPTVWDAVDYLAPLFKQAASVSLSRALKLVSWLEAPRLATYERWLTSQFPATLVISERDQALFQRDNPCADRIHLTLPGLPITPLQPMSRDDHTLVMTGTLNYHPNVASAHYFARDIFPLVLRHNPAVQLQLVGANPVSSIQGLVCDSIHITGFVPSVMDYLSAGTVAVAPVLYAAGMQNKVIEAFLTATPLVATSVALRGLDVRHDQEVLVADTPADFAAAVLRLLGDPDLRARLGAAGRAYVEQHHDLRQTTARLVALYEQVRGAGAAGV